MFEKLIPVVRGGKVTLWVAAKGKALCDCIRQLSITLCVKHLSDMMYDFTEGPLVRRGTGCVATVVQLKHALHARGSILKLY